MEAVKQTSYDWDSNIMERPIIDPNWKAQPSYSRKEFMDELGSQSGCSLWIRRYQGRTMIGGGPYLID